MEQIGDIDGDWCRFYRNGKAVEVEIKNLSESGGLVTFDGRDYGCAVLPGYPDPGKHVFKALRKRPPVRPVVEVPTLLETRVTQLRMMGREMDANDVAALGLESKNAAHHQFRRITKGYEVPSAPAAYVDGKPVGAGELVKAAGGEEAATLEGMTADEAKAVFGRLDERRQRRGGEWLQPVVEALHYYIRGSRKWTTPNFESVVCAELGKLRRKLAREK